MNRKQQAERKVDPAAYDEAKDIFSEWAAIHTGNKASIPTKQNMFENGEEPTNELPTEAEKKKQGERERIKGNEAVKSKVRRSPALFLHILLGLEGSTWILHKKY